MTIIRHIIAVVAVILLLTNSAPSFAADSNFSSWISELKKEAFKKGVSSVTFEKAFKNIKKPVQRVLDLDRKQPEFRQSYSRYISRAINDRRVNQGRKFLKKNHVLLRDIQKLYGVPPKYLMAFWGMETNYGGTFGGFSVIEALATLAYDERRAAFFRSELIHALKILETGDIASEKMIGSWAGAMGNFQFMPSTFTHYAVDYDGDKKRDVWGSIPDATASAANYLSHMNWDSSETWGRNVKLPKNFDWNLTGLGVKKTLSEWNEIGIRQSNGKKINLTQKSSKMKASVILPEGHKGHAFLVYRNFRVVMNWNRSVFYALAVCQLADRIAGKSALKIKKESKADEPILKYKDIKTLQKRLNSLGFNIGKPDGIFGSKSREATKKVQHIIGLPADGYPTKKLLKRLNQKNALKKATTPIPERKPVHKIPIPEHKHKTNKNSNSLLQNVITKGKLSNNNKLPYIDNTSIGNATS